MKKTLMMGAVVAVLVIAPAHAQQPATLEQVLRELQALNQRVSKLEQEKDQLAAQNAELAAKNDRLEATTEYLRSNASATRKEMAEDSPKIDEADRITKASEWASRISFKGDVRFRNETIDQEFVDANRNRDRIRLRAGMVAKVNDTVTAEIQLTTDENLSGGSDGDARSSNRTLTDANSRKEIDIDLGYIQWAPNADFRATFGKMRYPWVRPAISLFFDNDINPEGAALSWQMGTNGLFASAFYFDLAERALMADSNMAGGQIGWRSDIGKSTRFTVAASYFDHNAVQGYNAVQDGNIANAFGNTTSTTTCRPTITACIASDFDVMQGMAELIFTVANRPLTFFAEYAQNDAAEVNPVTGDKLDSAYAAGIFFGRVSAPRSWEVGYLYQEIENDALYGQWIDSDFAGGTTGSKGSVFRLGFGFSRNFRINATYFLNDTNIDLPATIPVVGPVLDREYKRLQLDLVASF
ncbi:MAG TPA: putative porin [Steroidobacteraceae bacterium]|nr:putative porin [Steroidobacteraceae bacterium]